MFLKDRGIDPDAPTEWSAEMKRLIGLFRSSVPPEKPFVMNARSAIAVDPAKFHAALAADIAAGPAGPRVGTGALTRDLVEYLLHARPVEEAKR